jgi:hypothetical protein
MSNPLIEQWELFEVVLDGPAAGNPFLDTQVSATFQCGNRVLKTNGFYDGEGVYRIRCMPDTVGN